MFEVKITPIFWCKINNTSPENAGKKTLEFQISYKIFIRIDRPQNNGGNQGTNKYLT